MDFTSRASYTDSTLAPLSPHGFAPVPEAGTGGIFPFPVDDKTQSVISPEAFRALQESGDSQTQEIAALLVLGERTFRGDSIPDANGRHAALDVVAELLVQALAQHQNVVAYGQRLSFFGDNAAINSLMNGVLGHAVVAEAVKERRSQRALGSEMPALPGAPIDEGQTVVSAAPTSDVTLDAVPTPEPAGFGRF